ncbi:MAG: glycosyltransferase family 4 protein [Alphaproteobacteria bacterium]|nr:glycosyltransferase family 4 protein [Alphaproteobacteria bacterium]
MIVLDLSRLLSRAGRETPSGIDRVELAYAEHLIAADALALFACTTALGGLGPVPRPLAEDFVMALAAAWRRGTSAANLATVRRLGWRARLAAMAGGERRLFAALRESRDAPVYLLVSHHHLEKPAIIARLKTRTAARFVCLIHDLIPIEYPEYAKPGQAENHRRRIETATRLADALIVNSAVTRDALVPYIERSGRAPPVLVAPLGLDLPAQAAGPEAPFDRPYFVCIGTIEAKKNHLLLLNVWRRLAAELGPAAPLLVLIGQRGWETENVVDMLDRSPGLRGIVIEHNALPDSEMVRILKGARALLLPSFAEGFGFPVIEAFSVGVPALCSDIPALRETGGVIAEYIDPLDGPGWHAAILDYASPHSPRRAAQLERRAGWLPPLWSDHFDAVDRFIAETAISDRK